MAFNPHHSIRCLKKKMLRGIKYSFSQQMDVDRRLRLMGRLLWNGGARVEIHPARRVACFMLIIVALMRWKKSKWGTHSEAHVSRALGRHCWMEQTQHEFRAVVLLLLLSLLLKCDMKWFPGWHFNRFSLSCLTFDSIGHASPIKRFNCTHNSHFFFFFETLAPYFCIELFEWRWC